MQRRPSSLLCTDPSNLQVKCYPLVFLVHWIYPFGIFILLDSSGVCGSILFKFNLCCYLSGFTKINLSFLEESVPRISK